MVRFASDPIYARITLGEALAHGDRDVARAALRLLVTDIVGQRAATPAAPRGERPSGDPAPDEEPRNSAPPAPTAGG